MRLLRGDSAVAVPQAFGGRLEDASALADGLVLAP